MNKKIQLSNNINPLLRMHPLFKKNHKIFFLDYGMASKDFLDIDYTIIYIYLRLLYLTEYF